MNTWEKLQILIWVISKHLLTFLEFAYGEHAVAGGEIPYAQGLIVAHSGTQWQMGVSGKTPDLALHVTLNTAHTHIV